MSPGSEADDSEKEKAGSSRGKGNGQVPVSAGRAPAKRRTKTGCISTHNLQPALTTANLSQHVESGA